MKYASSKGPEKGNKSGKPRPEYMTPHSAKNGKNRGMVHGQRGMNARKGDNPFKAAAKY